MKRTTPKSESETEVTGYLRAIHLNEDWIGVGPKEGDLRRLQASHDLVEDTLAGLVDHPVRVKLRRFRRSLVVTDVAEIPEEELTSGP